MRLGPSDHAIDFSTQDIYGKPLRLNDFKGKRVMLSFFRDAACPFCNLRLYELTHQYTRWKKEGLVVITVFSSQADQVKAFVARGNSRPFYMVSDPELDIYNRYGVEQSATALLKALMFKMPRIIGGIRTGGRPSKNPHVKLVPADFLIDEEGRLIETWYGRDTSDHIPLERIEAFIDEGKSRQLFAAAHAAAMLCATREQLEKVEQDHAAAVAYCQKLEARVQQLSHMNELQRQLLSAYKAGGRSALAAGKVTPIECIQTAAASV